MNKIVISDTSCLIALDRIGQLDILRRIFGLVYVTEIVAEEFQDTLPEWIIIENIRDINRFDQLKLTLDPGEASAIVLALEKPNSVLIIDEKKGRKIAADLNIAIVGTLKILLIAKEKGAISSVKEIIIELQKHSFRFSKAIIDEMLRIAREH